MSKFLKPKSTILFILPPLFFLFYTKARFIEIENEKQFNKDVMENKQPTLVQFSADWCGVCQTVKKPFESVAKDPDFKNVTFARVNIDKNMSLSKKHEITGVPTFLYINKGKKIKNEIGVKNIDQFQDSLRSTVRTTFNLTQVDVAQSMDDMMQSEEMPQAENMMQESQEQMPQEMDDDMYEMADETMSEPKEEQEEVGIIEQMQDTVKDVQETTEEANGFVNSIKNIIMGIINAITGSIKAIIEIIKGLFGR